MLFLFVCACFAFPRLSLLFIDSLWFLPLFVRFLLLFCARLAFPCWSFAFHCFPVISPPFVAFPASFALVLHFLAFPLFVFNMLLLSCFLSPCGAVFYLLLLSMVIKNFHWKEPVFKIFLKKKSKKSQKKVNPKSQSQKKVKLKSQKTVKKKSKKVNKNQQSTKSPKKTSQTKTLHR